MRSLVGCLVCVLLLGGAAVSGAQEPGQCGWATHNASVPDAVLFDVTAAGPTNVLAVGAVVNSEGRARTLVRHWDGASWQTQPSTNANNQHHQLNEVAFAPDGTAWAVGERRGRKTKTVVLRYDGTSWLMHSSLNPSEDRNLLNGVDVAPSGDVYAAGARWNAKRQYRTMVHLWDGESWKQFRSAHPGILWDLDVIAEDDIWAVGAQITASGGGASFAVHFDGTRWTEVAVPSPGDGYNVLYEVSAAAPDDVWAVGEWYRRGEPRAWIVHYDGERWSAPEIPDFSTYVSLRGVSALDADTAVIVGEDQDSEDSRVVLEWDGTSWARADQGEATDTSWPQAVELTPDGEGWAVGYTTTDPATDYVERRTCG